jgi:hypothetical protein
MTNLHLPDAERLVRRSVRICIQTGMTKAQAYGMVIEIVRSITADNPDLTPLAVRWAAELHSVALKGLHQALQPATQAPESTELESEPSAAAP